MARFDDCVAEGNGGDGFRIENPNSELSGCIAVGNAGHGFIDAAPPAERKVQTDPPRRGRFARFLVGVAQGALGGAAGNLIN